MTILFIIVAVIAALYVYAAIVQYYGFKNWYPMCGCRGKSCAPVEPSGPEAPKG